MPPLLFLCLFFLLQKGDNFLDSSNLHWKITVTPPTLASKHILEEGNVSTCYVVTPRELDGCSIHSGSQDHKASFERIIHQVVSINILEKGLTSTHNLLIACYSG